MKCTKGICGAHKSGLKMRWLIHMYGYYWPTIVVDCVTYAKGCEACQMHGPLQRVPAERLYAIVKPWPFRGWVMDLIDKIHPPSSKCHVFIIVANDYFTKWVSRRAQRVSWWEVTKIGNNFNGVATNIYSWKKSEKPFNFAKAGLLKTLDFGVYLCIGNDGNLIPPHPYYIHFITVTLELVMQIN